MSAAPKPAQSQRMGAEQKTSAPERWRDAAAAAIVVVIALILCWRWAGPIALDPQSVGWIGNHDRAMHTLGWWFFRAAPWGWPPGINPRLGIELANSIGLVDGLPLFAFPFKLLSPLLPEVFQYWGLWFLLCFALQALFGFMLARELGMSRVVAVMAGLFAVITPAFLFRLPLHMALAGHWLILAAIFLYVKRTPPRLYAWPLLLGAAAATHPFLLTIAGAVWIASILERLWQARQPLRRIFAEAAIILATVLVILWACGYFTTLSYVSFGYGRFKLNLMALFDPNEWSTILPNLPSTDSDYEGFNYLGIGILALLPIIAMLSVRSWRIIFRPRWLPLLVVTAGLVLFAISYRPAFLDHELVTLPLPANLEELANIFRSSGRMAWLAGYLISFAVLLGAARWFGRFAAPVLAVLFVVQVVDSAPGWARFRPQGPVTSHWNIGLTDPLWQALAPHYGRVRALPVIDIDPHWLPLSYYALTNGLSVDAVYLSRVDTHALAALRAAGEAALDTGGFDPEAIYVLAPELVPRAKEQLRPGDLLTTIDGLTVFARNGAQYVP